MSTVNAIFGALADQRRRLILEYLKPAPRSAGSIASRFEVSWPAISRHLRVLREAGLVTVFQSGRARQYSLNSAAVDVAMASLAKLGGGSGTKDFARTPATTAGASGREAIS